MPGKNPMVAGGNGPPPFGGASFFKDLAPKDGLLVGVEVVIGRPYADELILSVLPLYRVGKVGEFGKQFGTAADGPITLKAKAEYAVGGITVMQGLGFDGLSVPF